MQLLGCSAPRALQAHAADCRVASAALLSLKDAGKLAACCALSPGDHIVAATACPFPGLKKFLKKHAVGDTLAVLDAKLGGLIKEKLDIACVHK